MLSYAVELLIYELRAKTEQYISDMNKAVMSTETLIHVTDRLSSSLTAVGLRWSAVVTAPIVAFGYKAQDAAMRMDGLKLGLEAVTGSSKEAERQFKRLIEVAKLPGLGLPEAIQGSINLQAAGMSASLAERSLKAFGNALATVGKGRHDLEGVNVQLAQMISSGKLQGDELRVIAERVPQFRQAIKNAFGTLDTKELNKRFDVVTIIERTVRELERLKQITSGARVVMENFGDAVFVSMSKIGHSIMVLVGPVMEKLTPLVTQAGDAFEKLSPTTQTAAVGVAGVTAAIGPLLLIAGTLAGSFNAIITAMEGAGMATGVMVARFAVATAASIALKASLVGLAVGGIALIATTLADFHPDMIKFNNELERSQNLANKFLQRDIRKQAKVEEDVAKIPWKAEPEIAKATKELQGMEANINRAKERLKELEPAWYTAWQGGRKLWQGEKQNLDETIARYEQLKNHIANLKELQDRKDPAKFVKEDKAAMEAQKRHFKEIAEAQKRQREELERYYERQRDLGRSLIEKHNPAAAATRELRELNQLLRLNVIDVGTYTKEQRSILLNLAETMPKKDTSTRAASTMLAGSQEAYQFLVNTQVNKTNEQIKKMDEQKAIQNAQLAIQRQQLTELKRLPQMARAR